MSSKLIIGIHGLNNKPRRETLRNWWVAALSEGLLRNVGHAVELPEFQLSYWADLTHETPYTAANDPEPYLAAIGDGAMPVGKRGARGRLAALSLEAAGKILERVASAPFLEDRLDHLIESKAHDLYRYHDDSALRQRMRKRLGARLHEARREGRPVMLIAHSMGSIIAYDVLRAHPELVIDHLVTIGSPLGLADVKKAATREFGAPRIPDGVLRWTNLADPRDKIAALDLRLASDYAAGERCVRITDLATRNTYVGPTGKPNPHKVYGYLRAPEMSRIIAAWLQPGAT